MVKMAQQQMTRSNKNIFFRLMFSAVCVLLFNQLSYAQETNNSKKFSPPLDLTKVKKLIDSRCVICHGCYDAPCQLKLTSYQGLIRGGNKNPVYNPSRLNDEQPTRLFIDAHSTEKWHQLNFHSVITSKNRVQEHSASTAGIKTTQNNSVLKLLLDQKKAFPQNQSKRLPKEFPLDVTRDLSCPSANSIVNYLDDNNQSGMPYGMSAIPDNEQQLLDKWIAAGYPDFDKPLKITASLKIKILAWEKFFNTKSAENKLVSRYLYEHLFLGHLLISDNNKNYFFRLVRSTTNSGKVLFEIATAHPNGDPQLEKFFYRLRPITSTLVDKTHFIYDLNANKMDRWKKLFFATDWKVTHFPLYTDQYTSNPFLTYQDIPAAARYKFLLDDAFFFINNFIKGPVCRGQVALNVINDYFYVNFLDPNYDLSVIDDSYLKKGLKYLTLSKNKSSISTFSISWFKRLTEHQKYLEYRDRAYTSHPVTKDGFPLQAIWQDHRANNDMLTVFRHFDSGSVIKGFVGNKPATAWVVDFPIFERIFYDLVVNYNVYGSVSHQVLTRLYMDYLRMESESLLLAFLPKNSRDEQLKQWYVGSIAQTKIFFLHSKLMFENKTKVNFKSIDYFKELIEKIRYRAGFNEPTYQNSLVGNETKTSKPENYFHLLNNKQTVSSPWVGMMPEVVYLMVHSKNGDVQKVVSLLRNKAHTNVSFIFGEDLRRLPKKDTSIIIDGTVGSYPNLIFYLSEDEVTEFVIKLKKLQSETELHELVSRFGVRRTDPKIWQVLDDLQEYRSSKLNLKGILDMSRYRNL